MFFVSYLLAIHALPLTVSVLLAVFYNLFISINIAVTLALITAGVLGVIYIFYLQPLRTLCAVQGGSYMVGIREVCGNLQNGQAPVTVYYPVKAHKNNITNCCDKWTQSTTKGKTPASLSAFTTSWLPFNDTRYLDGLSAYSHVPRILLNDLTFVKIKACKDAPLASLYDEITKEVRPIIVFSHGLAGYAQIYSTFLMTMASRGAIVFALTHMDASAAYCRDAQTQSTDIHLQHCHLNQISTHQTQQMRQSQQKQPLQQTKVEQPKGNSKQKLHNLSVAFHAGLESTVQDRRSQLIQRTKQLSIAVQRVLSGELLLKIGASNQQVNKFVANKQPISLMGHSFGGASIMASLLHKYNNNNDNNNNNNSKLFSLVGETLQTMQMVTKSMSCEVRRRIAAAVALDPWHIILNSQLFLQLLKRNSASYTTPTLMLQTQQWMRIPENEQLVKQLITYSDTHSFVEKSGSEQ